MVESVTSVDIARPIAEVFEYLVNIDNALEWTTELVSVQHDGPIQLGATGVDVRTMGNKEIEMPWEVTAFEPPHRALFEYTEPFPAKADFIFEEVDGGTRVTCKTTLQPTGLWRLMSPLMAREAHKTDEAQFQKAKRILENG